MSPTSKAILMAEAARRANTVLHDPAVIKATRASVDDVSQALKSTGQLVHETRAAWKRTGA